MAKSAFQASRPAGISEYLSLLTTNRDYRLLWLGEVISLFGDWFNLIASAALISRLTSSGLAVGGLFVLRMLAPFLVSPLAGVVADRYNRKRLLVIADLLRAGVVLGFLLVRDAQQVWLLYALTAIQLGLSGMFFPARNALLPDIVSRQHIGAANALSSATWSVMLALGAAVGGVVAGRYGIYTSFVIDAVTFIFSAILIAAIGYRQRDGLAGSGGWRQALTQYLEGLDFLARRKDILMIAIQKGLMALAVGGAYQVVQVVIAEQVYKIGEGGSTSLGIQYAVAGIGTGLGPILARRLSGDQSAALRRMLLWAWVMSAVGMVISAPMVSFGVVLLGQTLRAAGSGINWVFTTQLLLQELPEEVRGRVFSTDFALFSLASAVAAYLGGWLFDRAGLGVGAVQWLMAMATTLAGLVWLAWLLRQRGEANS